MKVQRSRLFLIAGAVGVVLLLRALFDWHPPPSMAFEDPNDAAVAEHALSEDFRWFEEHPDWKFSDRSDKDASVLHWLLVHHDISDEMITQLVKFGSSTSRPSKEKQINAVTFSIIVDRRNWVEAMVTGGMDINKVMDLGFNAAPLFTATVHGRQEIVEYLVSVGADINVRSRHGQTAIFLTRSSNLKTLNYLLDNGADVTVVDKGSQDICKAFSFVPSPEMYEEMFGLYVSALRKVTAKGVDCYSGRRIVNKQYLTDDILKSVGLPLNKAETSEFSQ